jgi:hypothetical protein
MNILKYLLKCIFFTSPFHHKKSHGETLIDYATPDSVKEHYVFSAANRFNLNEEVVIYVNDGTNKAIRAFIHGRKGDMKNYLVAYGVSKETGHYSDVVLRTAHKIGKKKKALQEAIKPTRV